MAMRDPKKPLPEPTGRHEVTINKLSAQKNVFLEEARALNRLIENQEETDEKLNSKLQKEQKYMGVCKLIDNKIARCDGRQVKDGKKFVDDGSDVHEYLEKAKQIRLAKAEATQKAEKKLVVEKEKIRLKQKQEIEETEKILRRRKVA